MTHGPESACSNWPTNIWLVGPKRCWPGFQRLAFNHQSTRITNWRLASQHYRASWSQETLTPVPSFSTSHQSAGITNWNLTFDLLRWWWFQRLALHASNLSHIQTLCEYWIVSKCGLLRKVVVAVRVLLARFDNLKKNFKLNESLYGIPTIWIWIS